MYDYLIVGAGLFGAVFAHEAAAAGKRCLVIDKRGHIAGNIYTEKVEGIDVHRYGAHIFHTNNKKVWDYVNRFAVFNRYTNAPVANYKGELYNLPFNMNTFNKMWGVVTPAQAQAKIEEQRAACYTEHPKNLEEQAINLVGTDIYEKLIKGYTEKQWGRPCTALPAFIIKRLPVRLTFDNNYFNALYQGIPNEGYTALVANMLEGVEVRLNVDYLADREALSALARKVVYTGPIDAYFGYRLGALQYRSVRFEQPKRWICPTTRATPSSTIPTPKRPTPASSSTSISFLAPPNRAPKPSSAGNIPPSGSPATNLTTRSTMRKTARCTPATGNWRTPCPTCCSAAVWASINTMIWTVSSKRRWSVCAPNWPDVKKYRSAAAGRTCGIL